MLTQKQGALRNWFLSFRCAVSQGCWLLILYFSAWVAVAAPVPAPPQLSADSYLLIDFTSGKVLAEKDADKRIEPASLTKIMTSYIVARELQRGSISHDEPVIVSEYAQSMPGSRMFAEAGTIITVKDLLRGLIIQSGNDSSVALAEHIAGTEDAFAAMMNRVANEKGMQNTNYVNASGLPATDHYTTANDLAIITRATIQEFPEHYKMYSEREFTFNGIRQKNRNKLLWRDESVDGMKTGHTEAAGYCLVSTAVRNGDMRLISIVLGTSSDKARIAESQRLLNYGFRFFRTHRVYEAGEIVSEARIWMGDSESIPLGVAEDLWVTLPRDAFDNLQSQIEVSEYIRAPANIGEEFGRSLIKLENQTIEEVPLLALQKVDQAGLMRRMKHSIIRYFH
ncbi:MAG: D-alanyl-D-alanine carboxypeptidase [Gammaproteobacteria bacterium]|nr:D-alanyl-D-alanine carboxypeptidase [Gammaproteobacteria bacterium]